MGRRMNMGKKKPESISYELISAFEKDGWGQVHFTEFLKRYK
jgi:Ca2+-binding EF-hand superfamily protein